MELKINYFLPVTEGRIFARSHLLRIGSTLCVGNVDLTDEHGRAIGTAIVTYMIINVPAVGLVLCRVLVVPRVLTRDAVAPAAALVGNLFLQIEIEI